MDYAIAADIILVVHFIYVLFAVGGEIFIVIGGILHLDAIRKFSFRIVHLISVVVVAIEASIGVVCPLTVWEHKLRTLAGQYINEDLTFIGRIVTKVMFYDFPLWVFTIAYISFALLVILTLIILPPKKS